MYCPQCRSEYRQGFTRCSDCDVDLVAELPRDEAHDDPNLVKVYETGDAALIPLIESLLEDAKIEYEVTNTRRQYVTNSQLGYAEFWVGEDDAAEARTLLADLELSSGLGGDG
jgi:hypothetical protein